MDARPAKILTCDDSRTIRTVVSKYLKQAGCEVVEATNGQECIEVARREMPNLILLDVTMPIMDGLQALKAIRADADIRHLNVVMLTAVASKELVVEILKLGVRDYILKPFDQKELYRKVNKVLKLWSGDGPAPRDAAAADPAAATGATRQMLKILVIDDKENVVQMVRDSLQGAHAVATATSGADGIARAMEDKPDLILLDLVMPEMDGFQVFQKLRAHGKLADVRVVGMSIETQTDAHKRAKEMGFRRILTKPFTKKDLEDLVAAFAAPGPVLSRQGDVWILAVPDVSDPAARGFRQALATEVGRRIDEIAEEGFSKLVVDMGGVSDLELDIVERLLAAVARAQQLKIRARFVRPGAKALAMLDEFQETKQLEMFASLAEALSSFAAPA